MIMLDENKRGNKNSFMVQQPMSNASEQPLKVHHLSHDLRGPLNSILGFAELLLEGIEGPINEIQAEDLAAIRQSAKNLLGLINTVVDLSKLEDDRLALNFEPVQLDAIIETVMAAKMGAATARQVELIAQVPESLPPLWGDRERVEQMVLNLVNFAFKIKQDGQINIKVAHDDAYATLQIIAPKVWLPVKQLSELFELIVETDATGRSELGAGGLTMPLTQQLATKHQGRAWVENNDEVGVIFYLKLPLHQAV